LNRRISTIAFIFSLLSAQCLAEDEIIIPDASVLKIRAHTTHHVVGSITSVFSTGAENFDRLNFQTVANKDILSLPLTAKTTKSKIIIKYEPTEKLLGKPSITSVELQ
jgi:hypothetical protein